MALGVCFQGKLLETKQDIPEAVWTTAENLYEVGVRATIDGSLTVDGYVVSKNADPDLTKALTRIHVSRTLPPPS